MKLKRLNGEWKLDIFSAYTKPDTLQKVGVKTGQQALSLVTLKSVEQAKMLDGIAGEIEQGQLTTPDEIRQTSNPIVRQFITGAAQGPITNGNGGPG